MEDTVPFLLLLLIVDEEMVVAGVAQKEDEVSLFHPPLTQWV